MIRVKSLVEAIVNNLRSIPELVAILQGREEAIFAYHDIYPAKSSVALAIIELQPGQIMVAWNGTSPAAAPLGFWSHNVKVYIRAAEESETLDPEGYYELFRLIFDGVPEGQSLTMRQMEQIPECDPMENETIVRSSDAEGIDYFEVDLNFTEKMP